MPKHFDPAPEFNVTDWKADVIAEFTSAAGVTIDGVLLKDSTVKTDTIVEKTSATGVTADGVLLKDGGIVCADAATIEVDTINEATSAAGVTADGVLLKDGANYGNNPVQALTATGAITINNGVVFLNHATVVIAATLDAPVAGDELLIVDGSASGTAAHTVTLPAGVTFNVTGNNTATLNAPDESIRIVAQSTTQWRVVANNGSVGFSTV